MGSGIRAARIPDKGGRAEVSADGNKRFGLWKLNPARLMVREAGGSTSRERNPYNAQCKTSATPSLANHCTKKAGRGEDDRAAAGREPKRRGRAAR